MRSKPPPPVDIYLGPTAFRKKFSPLESQPWRCGEDTPGSKYSSYRIPGEGGWGGSRGPQETPGGLNSGPDTFLRLKEDTGFNVQAFRKWFLEKQIAKARGETEVTAALGAPKSFFEEQVHDGLFWQLRLTPNQLEALAKKFLVFTKLKMRSLRYGSTISPAFGRIRDRVGELPRHSRLMRERKKERGRGYHHHYPLPLSRQQASSNIYADNSAQFRCDVIL